MKLIKWPPEIDAIKMIRETIFGRIKNTDIWIDLDAIQINEFPNLPENLAEVFHAWASRT